MARAVLRKVDVVDLRPASFRDDLVAGLTARPKRIAPKYFYDEIGSKLFEKITELPEYYPTRTEFGILADNVEALAALVWPNAALVEFGSGSSAKVRLILRELDNLAAYVPVDISADFLSEACGSLKEEFPRLRVLPVAADFTRPFALPPEIRGRPLIGFFPGSTIGNFEPHEAQDFLRNAATILGPGSVLIVGVDLPKDRAVLNAAYNDAQGVTAAFNLNVLARANRELGTDFDLSAFEHRAFFNTHLSRIEMHLVSVREQKVRIGRTTISFAASETIHTENSYKYAPERFIALAGEAGWSSAGVLTDKDRLFSVHTLVLNG
jgi:dimethylhistidine N-methyltransferase